MPISEAHICDLLRENRQFFFFNQNVVEACTVSQVKMEFNTKYSFCYNLNPYTFSYLWTKFYHLKTLSEG